MTEKEFNNEFKFSLYQEEILLCEEGFSADQFNPFSRYSVDIRDILPRAITKLQKTLSKRNYNTVLVNNIDAYQYNQEIVNSYSEEYRVGMKYFPQPIVQQIDDKVIRGVECKIGLYINDKTIVERVFYVDGFNPVARWSVDIVEAIRDIVKLIIEKIRKIDIKNIWDDYDLINVFGLTINQVRELHPLKREELLSKIKLLNQ